MWMRNVSKPMWTALVVAALGACTATVENTADFSDDKVGVSGTAEVKSEARRPSELGALVDTTIEDDAIVLTYDGAVPAFAAGEVVLGTEKQGYLRRVTGVEVDGATVRLSTTAADVGDAFESLDLEAPAVRLQPEAPVV